MMVHLGLGSFACAWSIGVPGYEQPAKPMDAFGLMQFAAELGLHLVQIGDNIALDVLTPDKRNALRAASKILGVEVEVGTRGIEVKHLQEYIQIARFFNSPILRVVVDTASHHPSPDEVVSLIRQVLRELENANVTLAIENHDRFKARTFAQIVETLDHPNVGICLDTVNSFGSLEGPEVVVQTLGRQVVNLHVKEFIVRRLSHNMGFEITGVTLAFSKSRRTWITPGTNWR